jgi:histidinol-phosphatase (PHP family)
MFDQHLHSRHSFDSKADPRENVEAAIARGLQGLTFTEHFDTHPDDWSTCVYDDAAYSDAIAALRSDFGDRIFIGKGIEVCFQPRRMDFILDFLARHSFDMVLLSVHYFGELAVHERPSWEGVAPLEGARQYLGNVLRAVEFCERLQGGGKRRVFDVLGHLDLVKRYTQRFFGEHDVSPFAAQIDEILRGCLRADLTPEINTSTLRQGLTQTMPNADAVKRYAELGGAAMSVGSDSHKSADIGAGFDQAAAMLRDAGIPRQAIFRKRDRAHIEI